MSGSGSDSGIISGITFNASTDYLYTKPKVNASGGKSIGRPTLVSQRGTQRRHHSSPIRILKLLRCAPHY